MAYPNFWPMNASFTVIHQIIERGKHNGLIAKQGIYYNLHMSQLKKQEEVKEDVFATK